MFTGLVGVFAINLLLYKLLEIFTFTGTKMEAEQSGNEI